MKNNLKKLSLLFLSVSVLSACSLPGVNKDLDTKLEDRTDSEQTSPEQNTTPTPTLSNDSSMDSIEAELNSTLILEEDFSDI